MRSKAQHRPVSPETKPAGSPKSTRTVTEYSPEFAEFWKRWLDHTGNGAEKFAAYEVWKKLAPNAEMRAAICAGILTSPQSNKSKPEDKKFIPSARKWLLHRGWLDEPNKRTEGYRRVAI